VIPLIEAGFFLNGIAEEIVDQLNAIDYNGTVS